MDLPRRRCRRDHGERAFGAEPRVGSAGGGRRRVGILQAHLPAPPGAASAAASSSLVEELALVDDARRAVRAHDGARALAAIDAHDRRFPRGKLGLEITVLRIEALLAQGNRAAAHAPGVSFLAAHPDHVLSDRVRALLGTNTENQPR